MNMEDQKKVMKEKNIQIYSKNYLKLKIPNKKKSTNINLKYI